MSKKDIAKLLKKDGGLDLLNDLVSSSKNFLYESSDVLLANSESGDKVTQEIFRDANGVVNASNFGKDSSGRNSIRPRDGYDGQVVIANGVTHYEGGGNGNEVTKSRASLVFHELAENFERTNNGINYSGSSGAHQLSIHREKLWHRRSNMPGQVTRIVNPSPSTPTRKKNLTRMSDYLNN